MRRLDVDLKLPSGAPAMLQLKYQLLGAPEIDAKQGNVSLAVTVAAGSRRESGSYATQGNGVMDGSWELHNSFHDIAAILGKRTSDAILVYGGPFHTFAGYTGNIDQTTPTLKHYPYSGNANQSGANLGVQFGGGWGAFKVEGAWTLATDASARRPGVTGGAVMGIRW